VRSLHLQSLLQQTHSTGVSQAVGAEFQQTTNSYLKSVCRGWQPLICQHVGRCLHGHELLLGRCCCGRKLLLLLRLPLRLLLRLLLLLGLLLVGRLRKPLAHHVDRPLGLLLLLLLLLPLWLPLLLLLRRLLWAPSHSECHVGGVGGMTMWLQVLRLWLRLRLLLWLRHIHVIILRSAKTGLHKLRRCGGLHHIHRRIHGGCGTGAAAHDPVHRGIATASARDNMGPVDVGRRKLAPRFRDGSLLVLFARFSVGLARSSCVVFVPPRLLGQETAERSVASRSAPRAGLLSIAFDLRLGTRFAVPLHLYRAMALGGLQGRGPTSTAGIFRGAFRGATRQRRRARGGIGTASAGGVIKLHLIGVIVRLLAIPISV